MRGKRSKQYRKLMQQYGLHFGFREPYQVLLDAGILQDAARFKMDFVGGLERTLHGQIKPMITQCCIRHLYATEPKDSVLLEHVKAFERRRCNHHTLEQPLSTLECLSSVVDPKSSKTNKHRYVVASQDDKVRAYMRRIPGVPLIYLKRSVMIMEPMAGATEDVREREERLKFRAGLKGGRNAGGSTKRGREDNEKLLPMRVGADARSGETVLPSLDAELGPAKKKRKRGPSGPNPLSMKKAKKESIAAKGASLGELRVNPEGINPAPSAPKMSQTPVDEPSKRKRKRRHNVGKENQPEIDAASVVMPGGLQEVTAPISP